MKKFFIAVICIVLVLQSTQVYTATITSQEDKSKGEESYNTYGELLFEIGLVLGDPIKGLNEESNITRMEMAALIARVSLISTNDFEDFVAPSTPTFSDVSKTSWYYKYVEYLATTGITLGDGNGQFLPLANVTIEQTLMFLARSWPEYESYEWTKNNAVNAFNDFNIEIDNQIDEIDYQSAALRKDVFAFIVATLLNENIEGKTLWEAKELESSSIPTINAYKTIAENTLYEAKSVDPNTDNDRISEQPYIDKIRTVVMTDGEGDDQASMVRYLLYTNEMDTEAIIQTNSYYQLKGNSSTTNNLWLENTINAYGKVVSNLRSHDNDYPSKEYLESISYIGDEDINHVNRNDSKSLPPFGKTAGSEKIIELLLDDDERSIHFLAWGGLNTLAEALYKLKYSGDYTNTQYQKAASKCKIHSITYQDNSGYYIVENFPEVRMIRSNNFDTTWGYDNPQGELLGSKWVTNNLRGHGALGDMYPKTSIKEGDTPSFLNAVRNGLNASLSPSYGGWGGRFVNYNGTYSEANDNGSKASSIARFIEVAQNDFAARMDWCATESYELANHQPVAIIQGDLIKFAKAGDTISLDGTASYDPDGDRLTLYWKHYQEIDTSLSKIDLTAQQNNGQISFKVPKDAVSGDRIHIILEVIDNGIPKLVNYQRVIIKI